MSNTHFFSAQTSILFHKCLDAAPRGSSSASKIIFIRRQLTFDRRNRRRRSAKTFTTFSESLLGGWRHSNPRSSKLLRTTRASVDADTTKCRHGYRQKTISRQHDLVKNCQKRKKKAALQTWSVEWQMDCRRSNVDNKFYNVADVADLFYHVATATVPDNAISRFDRQNALLCWSLFNAGTTFLQT